VAIAVVGVTMAAGIGVGHLVWQSTATQPSSSASGGGGSTTPSTGSGGGSNPSGGGSTGSTGNGSNPGGSSGPTGEFPFGGGFPFGGQNPTGSTGGGTSTAPGSPSNVSSIASKVDPALVDINTVIDYGAGEAAGTGIVLTANGEVLTNNHVIDGATSISVTDVGNGKTYKATVVGYNRTSDVAVIQLQNASGLQTASIGDSSSVKVGQAVVAVGNAGGAGGTPSVAGGSVTSLNQSITASDEGGGNSEQLHGLIEINANIQPGDSGGSLVNTSGQVIGIDTAASSGLSFQSATTNGFAIPINTATSIASQIESGQASATVHIGASAFLGVRVAPASTGSATGAVVEGTLSGTPAATAGLTSGDVITAVSGQTITSANALTGIMTQHHPGDQITLTWTDSSGHQHSATVTLTSGPAA
jgi:S1-C subfamily serine protease